MITLTSQEEAVNLRIQVKSQSATILECLDALKGAMCWADQLPSMRIEQIQFAITRAERELAKEGAGK